MVGVNKIAQKLKKYQISALLIIGGFEVCVIINSMPQDFVHFCDGNHEINRRHQFAAGTSLLDLFLAFDLLD